MRYIVFCLVIVFCSALYAATDFVSLAGNWLVETAVSRGLTVEQVEGATAQQVITVLGVEGAARQAFYTDNLAAIKADAISKLQTYTANTPAPDTARQEIWAMIRLSFPKATVEKQSPGVYLIDLHLGD